VVAKETVAQFHLMMLHVNSLNDRNVLTRAVCKLCSSSLFCLLFFELLLLPNQRWRDMTSTYLELRFKYYGDPHEVEAGRAKTNWYAIALYVLTATQDAVELVYARAALLADRRRAFGVAHQAACDRVNAARQNYPACFLLFGLVSTSATWVTAEAVTETTLRRS
jgi:hypothetical protein